MKADRETIRELLRLYLEEYESEPGGYDASTFVDWVASAVILPGIGTDSLITFYQHRIAALRALWADAAGALMRCEGGCCRQVVSDNFGELVELWDCAPGDQRIELSPEGRARVFVLPSGFRTERYSWTAAGRAAIIELRRKAGEKGSK